jgi:hypothetical protein
MFLRKPTAEAQRGRVATKRIGVISRKDAKAAKKREILFQTWCSWRLGGSKVQIRNVSCFRKFAQPTKTLNRSSAEGAE